MAKRAFFGTNSMDTLLTKTVIFCGALKDKTRVRVCRGADKKKLFIIEKQ